MQAWGTPSSPHASEPAAATGDGEPAKLATELGAHPAARQSPAPTSHTGYYADVGVAYAWLVDLEARVLTAQRLESNHWLTIGAYSGETEARIPPFDVVPLHVADWWPPAAPESQR